jgi:hypothetical protein
MQGKNVGKVLQQSLSDQVLYNKNSSSTKLKPNKFGNTLRMSIQ